MGRSWYEIRNATSDTADIYLDDEIGSWGVTAKTFIAELQGIKAKTINLRVNSPGGDVFDGIAIYNALKRHPAAVHSVVDGLAASTASFITQAGDTVLMATGATMMIHEPSGMSMGDASDMTKMAETLDKLGDTIASLYALRAGGTEAEWRERMRAESWYRAQEAVDAKLADGLVESGASDKRAGIFNLSKFKNVPEWVESKDTSPPADEPDVNEAPNAIDALTQALIPPLAGAAGYQTPSPPLEHLLSKQPLKV
jgi:ATP-dependent protease ClpP protease subunit